VGTNRGLKVLGVVAIGLMALAPLACTRPLNISPTLPISIPSSTVTQSATITPALTPTNIPIVTSTNTGTPTNTPTGTPFNTPTSTNTPTTTSSPTPQATIVLELSPSGYTGPDNGSEVVLNYAIQLIVTGTAIQGVTVTVDVMEVCGGVSFIGFTGSPAGTVAGSVLEWNLGTLSAGTTQTLGYQLGVESTLPYFCTSYATLTYSGGSLQSNGSVINISPEVPPTETYTSTTFPTPTMLETHVPPPYTPTFTPTPMMSATVNPTVIATATETP
jgi:hypothetical protein